MKPVGKILEAEIYPVLAPVLKKILMLMPDGDRHDLTEIRLRIGRPLLFVTGVSDMMVDVAGRKVQSPERAYCATAEDVGLTMQAISRNSLYAFEQELRQGYITIAGGHRVGLAGQAAMEAGVLKTLKNIASLNIRIAREVQGCADALLPYLRAADGRVFSTLIIAPPRSGKTTLLRDLVRQLSRGDGDALVGGVQVGVVDERSEIAACCDGVPTVALGPRVDVLDACPKASGILMLIRSMSPHVVVTDELGRAEDATAVREALHAGISVIASVHGRNAAEMLQRPYICQLIEQRYFDRYVILDNCPQVGTITEIIDAKHDTVLYKPLMKGAILCG